MAGEREFRSELLGLDPRRWNPHPFSQDYRA
jgi:hypothetical protein